MTRSFKVLLISLLIFPRILIAGDWSAPVEVVASPKITFQWCLLGPQSNGDRNRIAWEFTNSADSVITFNYVIISDQGEKLSGRTVLQPHSGKKAGATFRAQQLIRPLVDNIVILGNRDVRDKKRSGN